MTSELKPCPFCGCTEIDPEGVSYIPEEFHKDVPTWHVAKSEHIKNRPACSKCNATTDGDWNTRYGEK